MHTGMNNCQAIVGGFEDTRFDKQTQTEDFEVTWRIAIVSCDGIRTS